MPFFLSAGRPEIFACRRIDEKQRLNGSSLLKKAISARHLREQADDNKARGADGIQAFLDFKTRQEFNYFRGLRRALLNGR